MSYRGSTGSDASHYKKGGHTNEEAFAKLIGGSTDNLPPQGKTDVLGLDGVTYSVKGLNKKWQIFLYSPERILKDHGFKELSRRGFDLSKMQRCFPEDYRAYSKAKDAAKKIWREMKSDQSGIRALDGGLGENLYVRSKMCLSQANELLLGALKDKSTLGSFIKKAIFNGNEVQKLAIGGAGRYHVFESEEVVEFLSTALSPSLSGTGGHLDDISIPGQKIVFRNTTNVMELEVRNDSEQKYRLLRLNMISPKATSLLVENSTEISSKAGVREMRLSISNS